MFIKDLDPEHSFQMDCDRALKYGEEEGALV